MMTIHEVSAIAGVSVRTLHHYDAIGLLPPTSLTEAGYRLYDDTALARLQSILLFRELEFPLKDIRRILDDPQFDPVAALADQIRLLELRQEQLTKLITLARETLKTGVIPMKFDAFDKTEQAQFAAEVKEKWGGTAAYQEYQQREQVGTTGDPAELMAQFTNLGKLKALDPAAPEVQDAIHSLQQFITQHFYTCTPEILAGLGEMYVADERFRRNIDRAGGDGTAAFARSGIRAKRHSSILREVIFRLLRFLPRKLYAKGNAAAPALVGVCKTVKPTCGYDHRSVYSSNLLTANSLSNRLVGASP